MLLRPPPGEGVEEHELHPSVSYAPGPQGQRQAPARASCFQAFSPACVFLWLSSLRLLCFLSVSLSLLPRGSPQALPPSLLPLVLSRGIVLSSKTSNQPARLSSSASASSAPGPLPLHPNPKLGHFLLLASRLLWWSSALLFCCPSSACSFLCCFVWRDCQCRRPVLCVFWGALHLS